MILQQLYMDAGAIVKAIVGEELPPPMYDIKPVRWVIPLSADGKLKGNFLSLPGKRGTNCLIPYVGRTVAIRPILLADTPAYVLGIGEDKRALEKHNAFKTMVQRCAQETQDPLVEAVDKFLETWNPATSAVAVPPDLTKDDLITFEVDGDRPTDSPSVQRFWAQNAKPIEDSSTGDIGQCLVTGVIGPIQKSLPGMIKRIPGGQTSGTALVSANAPAFESYGFERALTSPVSQEAAERFTKALNALIAGERTHLTVGKLVYVFWTGQGQDDDFLDFIDKPDSQQVQKLLQSYRTGSPYSVRDAEAFYAFALSASGGRAVIRDWLSTTVKTARDNLSCWFAAQRIVGTDGTPGDYFGIYRLAAGLYRDANKELVAQVPQALMRAAIHGEPVPTSLLGKLVMRNRAEQRVTRNRAALIKAVFVTQEKDTLIREEMAQKMASLDIEEARPAYLCGRLLAELEVVQRAALGKINATLTDKYFGAASTAPSTVFGILLTNANKAHLPKIRKQSVPTYNALQNRLAQIVTPLQSFPRTLNLEQQGLFALGYYHQRAQNLADALAAKARQQQEGTVSPDTEILAEALSAEEAI